MLLDVFESLVISDPTASLFISKKKKELLFAIPPKFENITAVGWALTGISLLLSKICINGRMGTEETNPLLPGSVNV